MIVVATAGGFDPIHVGHIAHLQKARQLGDSLTVILARDEQLINKKGYYFQPYEEREAILQALRWVDKVVPNLDSTTKCSQSLLHYRPNIFAKGGDRTLENMQEECPEELEACKCINCKVVYRVEGIIRSSSEIVRRIRE